MTKNLYFIINSYFYKRESKVSLSNNQYNVHLIRLENEDKIKKELDSIKVDRKAFDILVPKMTFLHLKLEKVDTRAANIIKQYLSSIGGEAAISKDAYYFTDRYTDMIISGSKKNLILLTKKIADGKYGLPEIAKEIERNLQEHSGIVKIGNKVFDFNQKTYIMGVLCSSIEELKEISSIKNLLKKIETIIRAGADIVDIWGEIFYNKNCFENVKEILPNLVSLIKSVKIEYPDALLSIDTTKIEVAREAIDAGIDLINHSIPFKYNEELIKLLAKYKYPIVLMHNSNILNNKPKPLSSITDVLRDIQSNISYAMSKGIEKDKIIIDPGIGFGKSEKDNLLILKQLSSFKIFNLPILVGFSKYNFLGEVLKGKVDNLLLSSITANIIAIINGANILRITDCEHLSTMKKIIDSMKNNSEYQE